MICKKMKNIVNYMKTQFNNDLKKYDLTASQYVVLKYLLQNDDKKIIQKDIAQYLALKHTTVIGIIKRLEEKGFIKKDTNYFSIITITNKGKNTYECIGDYEQNIENDVLKMLSNEEQHELSKLIDKIYTNYIEKE